MRTGYNERQNARHAIRLSAVCSALVRSKVTSVLDLGCGDGQLIELLIKNAQFTKLTGLDKDRSALKSAKVHTGKLASQRTDLELEYRYGLLEELPNDISRHEAITLVEIIEHLHLPDQVNSVIDTILSRLQPQLVIITSPTSNGLPPTTEGHLFEWTREEAVSWAREQSKRYGYRSDYKAIDTHPWDGPDVHFISFSKIAD